MPARYSRLLAALLLIGAVLVTHRGVLDLAMMGWDGWPLVAAARVESFGDLVGTFGERLMDGRYPHGEFYRPVTHLVFALDEALTGLDPRGYHRTDLALLALDTLLVAALVARLAGGPAGVIAGLVFALHPVQLELLPVPARRADALALGFALACLLAQPRPGAEASSRRRIGIASLAFLAAGSKETGAFVVPAVLGWHLALGGGAALRRTLPTFAGVLALVVARTAVLGGLGGHSGQVGPSTTTAALWRGLLEGVIYPEPLLGAASAGLLAALALLLTAATVALIRRAGEPRRALAAIGLLALSILGLTSLADRLHAWYAVALAAPYAALLGVLIAHGVGRARSGERVAGGIAGAVGLALALSHVAASPLVREYPLLTGSSDWLQQKYDELDRAIEKSRPGDVVRLNPWPVGVTPNEDGSDVQSLALAQTYTVAAWLELRFPELETEVVPFDGGLPTGKPGVVIVQLVPGAAPGWLRGSD